MIVSVSNKYSTVTRWTYIW